MIHIPAFIARVPVVRGILRLAITAYSHVFKGRYSIERREGLLLLLDRENAIDWLLTLSGEWEKPHLTKLFELARQQMPHAQKGAIFLDIGAHWGLYALKAHQSKMFEQIVAFEPDPFNYAQLQANLFLNSAEAAIRAYPLAATDGDRTFTLFQRNPHNRGATRVVAAEEQGGQKNIVRGTTVDSLIDVSDKLLVIKIDVESHELETIAGMMKLFARNRFVIQIEIWDTPKEESDRRLKFLTELFAAHGAELVHSIDHDYFYASILPKA
ncbi:MAG: FkbM family methyltransferase [Proteobacteria bacterium]|nr:FkbM family methyltransferase [Pseudomonadota bacterium]